MSLLSLILKNMRQRRLSTWLTTLSVALGTMMGVALLILGRETPKLFGQADFGYSLVIGGKGDPLQLVLNNAYLLGSPPGVVDIGLYHDLAGRDPELSRHVEWAVPIIWGDTHEGRRIIGTDTSFFTDLTPRRGRPIELAAGRAFEDDTWQAVVGSEAARTLGIDLGYRFRAFHGNEDTGHFHEDEWDVVGILAPTGTAFDRAVYVPLATQYALGEHGQAILDQQNVRRSAEETSRLYDDRQAELDAIVEAGGTRGEGHVLTPEGKVLPLVPEELWRISGILVGTRGGFATSKLDFAINNGDAATAARPGDQMGEFFETFLQPPARILLMVTAGVMLVAAVSILVGIYNSVQARRREVAILRSLGATRDKVLLLVAGEATLIGIIGAVVGMVGGHAMAAIAGELLRSRIGGGIAWWTVGPDELAYVGGVVILAMLAGIVPASLAYRTSVAEHLAS
ncbi:MAG: ABC transporter permease [Planctomycetota bacterium]